MADTNLQKIYLDWDGLQIYDSLLKAKMASEDAKSLKTVTLVGNKLMVYRVDEPVGDTKPAYEIELPEADLSNLIEKITNATAGNVVTAKADGSVADSGIAISDLVLKVNVYTRKEVEDLINAKTAGLWHFVGTVDTVAQLPADAHEGDVYIVKTAPEGSNAEYGRKSDGTWEYIGATLDLTSYATKTYVDGKVADGVATAKSYTDSKIETVNTRIAATESDVTSLDDRLGALETTVGAGVGTITEAQIRSLFS